MDEIISYKMCAVKVRNAKLRNYLNIAGKYVSRARGYLSTKQILQSWQKVNETPIKNQ
jgi:hypothetical protein